MFPCCHPSRPAGRISLQRYDLLAMARTQKVDITKISVLALAQQYLDFISEARRLRLEAEDEIERQLQKLEHVLTELTSAVRVASLEHPALAEGLPVRLVARMP